MGVRAVRNVGDGRPSPGDGRPSRARHAQAADVMGADHVARCRMQKSKQSKGTGKLDHVHVYAEHLPTGGTVAGSNPADSHFRCSRVDVHTEQDTVYRLHINAHVHMCVCPFISTHGDGVS